MQSGAYLIIALLAVAPAGSILAGSVAAPPTTKPATAPVAAEPGVVQAKVVINGQEIQLQGNGRIQMQVAGGQVVVDVGADNENRPAVPQPVNVRPGLVRVGPTSSDPPVPDIRQPLANVPAKLIPFLELTYQCTAYRDQTCTLQWKTVYDEEFAAKDKPSWSLAGLDSRDGSLIPAADKAKKLTLGKNKDRTVLNLDAEGCGGATLAVGPKVRGNYAIEMVAANHSANPSDLSLFIGQTGQWIGLQFGGQGNQLTAIWAVRNMQPDGQARVIPMGISNPPRIEPGRFYKIRVEVIGSDLKAYIDDKLIGQRKLTNPDETKADQQPNIYTFASKISVDRVKTEMQVLVQNIDADKVWNKVFADKTREQITRQIEDLVEMLADEDAAVRDTATEMLKRIGPLAVQPVKAATNSGIMEQAGRAKEILIAIQPG